MVVKERLEILVTETEAKRIVALYIEKQLRYEAGRVDPKRFGLGVGTASPNSTKDDNWVWQYVEIDGECP